MPAATKRFKLLTSTFLPQCIMKSFTSMLKRANIFSFFFSIFLRRNNI